MTSLVFSILLLLQAAAPTAPKLVNGRLSVEGGGQIPSSITLPLTPVGAPSPVLTPAAILRGATAPQLMIRLHIDGTFRAQIAPGEYNIGAPGRLPPGYSLQSITYGGVDLMRNPLKISASDSSELVINLATSGPSPAVSVSGRVTGLAPGQIERISLREASGGELSAALETSVGADGSFTFPKVLPGNYIVYMRLRTVTQVMVGNTNVTNVIVAHPQDILVSGHVILEGAQTTIPAVTLEGNGKTATSNRTGTFVLSLGKGENSVAVRGVPEGYQLKSIKYGDVDLQKEQLKLDGPAIWDIFVRLTPKN